MPGGSDWLAQVQEEILEPERAICDPHHHLWDHTGIHPSRYLLHELLADIGSGHRVLRTVFVECGAMYRADGPEALRMVGETEFVQGIAAVSASGGYGPARVAAGIVSRADLTLYHPQIPELTSLARAFPDATIVFDHFGGPLGIGPYAGRRDEVFNDWRAAVDELARCPNVVAKLGGLNMTINGWGWAKREKPPTSEELTDATRHYYLHTIDRFGPARCMFESNFPVDQVSCSYAVLWNAFKRMAASFSEEEKRLLFHDTAVRVYRIA